ncbi:MAG: hypothetical protein ACREU9_09115 [Gammaproteobacteria bacterium]
MRRPTDLRLLGRGPLLGKTPLGGCELLGACRQHLRRVEAVDVGLFLQGRTMQPLALLF